MDHKNSVLHQPLARVLRSCLLLALVTFGTTRLANAQRRSSEISLTLVDAVSDTDIRQLEDGDVIALDELGNELNIRAEAEGAVHESAVFTLNGELFSTESVEPYALAGDDGQGDYRPWEPVPGDYVVSVSLYSNNRGQGDIVAQSELTIVVVPSAEEPVDGGPSAPDDDDQPAHDDDGELEDPTSEEEFDIALTLINAETDNDIELLEDGDTIAFDEVGTSFNIRAESQTVAHESAVFRLNGQTFRTESAEPYAMAGDNGQGDYGSWTPDIGQYELEVLLYDQNGGRGEVVARRLIQLEIVAFRQPEPSIEQGRISGELKTWHPIQLDFTGPAARESDNSPNPFLDYRLEVEFFGPNNAYYKVPGFFSGNGEQGNVGSVWRVRFTPDQAGNWSYVARFRAGNNIAISLDSEAGTPDFFDGNTGTFSSAERDPDAPGFLRYGRLGYIEGKRYFKFKDGPYWLKGGTDSPENFLAYEDFDNTIDSHTYAPHIDDHRDGDPTWAGGRGKGIIGALNALADQGVNSLYALTMNIGGDGRDVWPWIGNPDVRGSSDNDNLHYDISKLDQWNIVFEHAQRQGIMLHLVLNEGESRNQRELDNGTLGIERKLYYRELIARFGHHLAIQWNISEEYNLEGEDGLSQEEVRRFASYIQAIDPYNHPITVHPAKDPIKAIEFTFGDSLFSSTSIQIGQRRIDEIVETALTQTIAAGRPLPIQIDEYTVDVNQEPQFRPVDEVEKHRKEKIWPTYFSGGQLEIILSELLSIEQFDSPNLQELWSTLRIAREFIEDNLPFDRMVPRDDLVVGESTLTVGAGENLEFELDAQVFALAGEVYAIYYPNASVTGMLDLSETEKPYTLRWFNPRTGIFVGQPTIVEPSATLVLNLPDGVMTEVEEDWVALLEQVVEPRFSLRKLWRKLLKFSY